MIDLGSLGDKGAVADALAINDPGQVVGVSLTVSGKPHAFVWTAKDGMQDLGTLPEEEGSIAWAINSRGQAVGSSPMAVRACLWRVTKPDTSEMQLYR